MFVVRIFSQQGSTCHRLHFWRIAINIHFAWFADSILCGNWLDDGRRNGLEFSIVWDSNSFYNSTCGGIYATGLFTEQFSIYNVFCSLYECYNLLLLNSIKFHLSHFSVCFFQEGTSNYFKGLMLILCYLIVAASFFVHVDPKSSKYSVYRSTSIVISSLILKVT
jgi:hypothetical protein